MFNFCNRRHHPHSLCAAGGAGTDVIDDPTTAVTFICEVADLTQPSVVVLLLDAGRHCVAVVHITGVSNDDAVVEVASLLLPQLAERTPGGAVVLASVRPGGSETLDDIDRWLELDACAFDGGLELLDWFVLGAGLGRPRTAVGAPSRWAAS